MTGLWSDFQPATTGNAPAKAATAPIEGATALKSRLHARLLDVLNLGLIDRTPRDTLRHEIRGAVMELLAEESERAYEQAALA